MWRPLAACGTGMLLFGKMLLLIISGYEIEQLVAACGGLWHGSPALWETLLWCISGYEVCQPVEAPHDLQDWFINMKIDIQNGQKIRQTLGFQWLWNR